MIRNRIDGLFSFIPEGKSMRYDPEPKPPETDEGTDNGGEDTAGSGA